MRVRFSTLCLILLATLGCPAKTSYPGDMCDEYVSCDGDLECIGYRCVANCRYEGDCDEGYRCDDGHCLASCESQDDCNNYGTCGTFGPERRGKACMLTNLPECSEDFHCGGNLCFEERCEQSCDAYVLCGVGMKCRLIDDYRGYCVVDPDYVPPATNCADDANPDEWCRRNWGGVTCNVTARICEAPIVGVQIQDVSYNQTADQTCNGFATAPEAGADIVAVQLFDAGGGPVPLGLHLIEFGISAGDIAYDEVVLNREPFCEPQVTSIGCAGRMVVTARAADGSVIEIPSGGSFVVAEREAACQVEDTDRFDVRLCRDMRELGGDVQCDGAYIAYGAGDTVMSWPIP